MKSYDWYITPEEYEIAAQNGIKRDTLEHRIRYHGWDKEKAITEPVRGSKQNKWIEIANKNGICRETFNSRIYNCNWSLEEAATIPVKKKYPKWAREELKKNGIKYTTFTKRIENGWEFKRAYTEKTWNKLDALNKARVSQKKLNTGPYKAINDYWKITRCCNE